MTILFNEIPVDTRTPGVYSEIHKPRLKGSSPIPRRLVIFGQMLASGTWTAGQAVQILSDDQARAGGGIGSMIARSIIFARKNRPDIDLWAVPLADVGTGAAAAGSLAFTGTATEAGAIYLLLGGQPLEVPVASGATAATIAAAAKALIAADAELPVTDGTISGGTLPVTYKHKGLVGNGVDMQVNYQVDQKLPAGISLVITQLTGGTSNPDIMDAFDAIPDDGFINVMHPWSDSTNLTAEETEMARRFNAMVDKRGLAITGFVDTAGNTLTHGATRNSALGITVGIGEMPTTMYEFVAGVAAQNVGEAHPARPRTGLVVAGALPPKATQRWDQATRNSMLKAGIATYRVAPGNVVEIETLCTRYQKNSLGQPDVAWWAANTVETAIHVTQRFANRIATDYPRHMAADDGAEAKVDAGVPIATPSMVLASAKDENFKMEREAVVENAELMNDQMRAERHATDVNRFNLILPPDFVNQLNVVAVQVLPVL